MAYFEDLTEYVYSGPVASRPGTNNIGWLEPEHEFEMATPSEDLLDRLWSLCSVSVDLSRGVHICPFCPKDVTCSFERNGRRLLLGAAEVRAFGADGTIYAAPTLVYHYVQVHHYRPPTEFVEATRNGPIPPNPEYFKRLENLGLAWSPTASGEGRRRVFPTSGPG